MSRFKLLVTGLVTAIWTGAYIKNISRGTTPPAEITVPFLVVLGWLSGSSVTPRNGDDPNIITRLIEAIKPPSKDKNNEPPVP